jgi:hypothetical protein|uniref:Uncharacterized protein n=1 Tax=viral metagenome TaxID=1070528 RepID=A0A6C0CXL4_9ZZZZ
MNDLERLNLQKMIQANDAENNTHLIRNLKHSKLILNDVDELLKIKKQNPRLAKSNPDVFDKMCISKCQFLFNNYTDIFNKVKKDEIDLNILVRLLNVLHSIEEGQVDQHEGSFEVGKLLKQIYIDSALKKADKLEEKYSDKKGERKKPEEKITWKQFKERNK